MENIMSRGSTKKRKCVVFRFYFVSLKLRKISDGLVLCTRGFCVCIEMVDLCLSVSIPSLVCVCWISAMCK